ncbi:MAG: glycoside hydrolase family 127 protein, partial [Bacteroidales bacterium]|nr:glycoside hydrolase family 127 protein [Bacteroidales bacterium]
MIKLIRALFPAALLALIITGCIGGGKSGDDYPITPVPFTSVKVTDDFWAPRIQKNASVTIPIAFGYCESTGRVRNFEIAG